MVVGHNIAGRIDDEARALGMARPGILLVILARHARDLRHALRGILLLVGTDLLAFGSDVHHGRLDLRHQIGEARLSHGRRRRKRRRGGGIRNGGRQEEPSTAEDGRGQKSGGEHVALPAPVLLEARHEDLTPCCRPVSATAPLSRLWSEEDGPDGVIGPSAPH
jgi:hypothetical protein